MTGLTVEGRLHDAIHTLTAAEKRTARALLANYPTAGLAPVAEFARQAGVSAATISRFVVQLGFKAYPDFQRALRDELEERVKSPLQRSTLAGRTEKRGENVLGEFLGQVAANLEVTGAHVPASEFEAACQRLADAKHACHLGGGRFTDPIAAYLEAHLRILRPGVRRLDGRVAARADQLLDVKPGDVAVIFDIRRYDAELMELAAQLAGLKAVIILVTDEWISPVSRYARIVIPCRTRVDRTWDSNTALFAVIEAMIARVTELAWHHASRRMGLHETR